MKTRIELPFQSAGNSEIPDVLNHYRNYDAFGLATYIYDAVELSMDVIETQRNPAARRFVILLSDGEQFTVAGNRRPDRAVAAQEAVESGIPIHNDQFQTAANPGLTEVSVATSGKTLEAAGEAALTAAFDTLLDEFRVRLER